MTRSKDVNRWSRARTVKACALVFLIVAVLASIFLPEIASLYWHVTHGRSTTFGAFKVPVPWGWWASRDAKDDTTIIQKPRRFFRLDRDNSDILIAPFIYPQEPVFDHEKWKRIGIEIIEKRGYRIVGENATQLVGENGYCLRFESIENSQSLWTKCDFPGAGISISFIGDRVEAPALESVIRQVTVSY